MRDQFYIVHRTANRVRLKIPARRHDAVFFAELRRRLLADPKLAAVAVNPLTASVLVEYTLGGAGADATSSVPGVLNLLRPLTKIDARLVDSSERARLELVGAMVELALAWVTGQHLALIREWCAAWVMRLAVRFLSAPSSRYLYLLSAAQSGPASHP